MFIHERNSLGKYVFELFTQYLLLTMLRTCIEIIFISLNSDTDGAGYIVQVWRLNHWKVK